MSACVGDEVIGQLGDEIFIIRAKAGGEMRRDEEI